MRVRRASAIAICAAALLAASCTAPTARIPIDTRGPQLLKAPFGDLVEQVVDAPGNLYLRRPRPDFGSYRALRFEQPAIYYDTRVTPPLLQDHSLLTRNLSEANRTGVGHSIPLPVVALRGPGVLLVRAEIADLEFDRARASNSRVTSIIQPGSSAMFILEIADDETGTPLLRIAGRRQLPGGIYTGPWSPDIDRSIQLFRGFVEDARKSLAFVVRPARTEGADDASR